MADEAQEERKVAAVLKEEDLPVRLATYEAIVKDFPTQQLKEKSRAERQDKEDKAKIELAYSEIGVNALHHLLNTLKSQHLPGQLYEKEGTFLDLGCGAGKACVAAALLHPFKKVIGIECLGPLQDVADECVKKYNDAEALKEQVDPPLPDDFHKPEIEIIKGDFVNEFDDKVKPHAADVVCCLACATTYGEEQLEAMRKLADAMPENSFFITVSNRLAESLIIDLNRNPRQRRAKAIKKTLSKRGMEPAGVEFLLDCAPNAQHGWRQLYSEAVELEWGKPMCYIFKKHSYPYCYTGDLCMVTMPPPADAKEPAEPAEQILALYEPPVEVTGADGENKLVNQAKIFEDHTEKLIEVDKVHWLTPEDHVKAKNKYASLVKEVEAVKASDTKTVEKALAEVSKELSLPEGPFQYVELTAEGKLPATADQMQPMEATTLVSKKLAAAAGGVCNQAWVANLLVDKFLGACHAQDEEQSGTLEPLKVQQAWGAVLASLLEFVQDRKTKVDEHQFP